jgi:MerR HTH family regulatory protein
MSDEVSAGVLAEKIGVPVRTIQFWTDAGVLRAIPSSDRQGRGRHRMYRTSPFHGELACGLIAAEMQRLKLPVGVMRSILSQLIRWRSASEGSQESIIAYALRGVPMALIISLQEPTTENPDGLVITIYGDSLDGPHRNRSGYFLDITEILKPLSSQTG